uniref:MORN repeat-containing protein 5 n=1 Tax=Haptolina ericina TaxID=156174 RepID=A0A7S3BM63_9EUKA|mmetsp:Transcript_61317/g.136564  ORF Transcript_61317/g.136564 Transcript_61317/m.136564 type:complete len:215 (+) Transcript_61317:26-670(+)
MADDDEEVEVKLYVYEGEREEGETVEIAEGNKTATVTLLGARSGTGKGVFPNGDVFEGAFSKGVRDGAGKYTYAGAPPPEEDEEPPPPVATYEGSWKNGQKSGTGTIVYADGSKYQGQWAKGKRHGMGAFYYANGDIYSGDWKDGKKEGHGTYICTATQTQLKGTWVAGVCTKGIFSDRYGNTYEGDFSSDATSVAFVAGGGFTFPSGATTPCC